MMRGSEPTEGTGPLEFLGVCGVLWTFMGCGGSVARVPRSGANRVHKVEPRLGGRSDGIFTGGAHS